MKQNVEKPSDVIIVILKLSVDLSSRFNFGLVWGVECFWRIRYP